MKDKLTHEVEILGRSVSVLLLAGLIMAAGASAALLDSFGTVSGEATVDQAVTLNGNNVEDQSASWALSSVTAGESVSGEAQTLNNNLDELATVALDASVTPASTSEDVSTTDKAAYDAEYLLLQNGESFSNVEPYEGSTVDGDKASTAYVYTGSETGLKAGYTSETGHVHSGLWFDVPETSAEDVVIDPEVASGSNDWIYAVVEYGGTPYVTGVFSGNPDQYDPDSNTDYSYALQDSEGSQITDIGEIKSRTDFEKDKSDMNALPGDASWEDITVHYAVAGTGTQDGGSDELTYTDFSFADDGAIEGSDSLITRIGAEETLNQFEAPSGNHELGFAADFKVNAYPGSYTFDLSLEP